MVFLPFFCTASYLDVIEFSNLSFFSFQIIQIPADIVARNCTAVRWRVRGGQRATNGVRQGISARSASARTRGSGAVSRKNAIQQGEILSLENNSGPIQGKFRSGMYEVLDFGTQTRLRLEFIHSLNLRKLSNDCMKFIVLQKC